MLCVSSSSSSPLLRVADRAVLPWLTLICDGKESPLQGWRGGDEEDSGGLLLEAGLRR
jgi:hypothetical protein